MAALTHRCPSRELRRLRPSTDTDVTTSSTTCTHSAADEAPTASGQTMKPPPSANVHNATGADTVYVEMHASPALSDAAVCRNIAEANAICDNPPETTSSPSQTAGITTPDTAAFTVDVGDVGKELATKQERQPLGARRERERDVSFRLGLAIFLAFAGLIAPLSAVAHLQRHVNDSGAYHGKTSTCSTDSSHDQFLVIKFQEDSMNHALKPGVDNVPQRAGVRNNNKGWLPTAQSGATPPCTQVISSFANQLDKSYNPCTNLYDHVCSRWQAKYANIATERGCYSVDDLILDKYRDKLARRLVAGQRQFFNNCVRGAGASEGEIEEIMEYLSVDTSLNSPKQLAETIARLARIGISPFFDVSLTVAKEAFYVTLLRPTPFKGQQCQGSYWGNTTTSSTEAELKQDSFRPGESEFLQALRHHLCLIVAQSSGLNVSCFLTSDSVITPSWNYEWYSTVGLKTLASNAASLFWPFVYSTKYGNDKSVESASNIHLPVSTNTGQAEDCLAFLERYDPVLLTSEGVTALGTRFEKGAKNTLPVLKRILDQKIYGANNVSSQLRIILNTEDGRLFSNHSSNIFSDDALFNGSTLEKHLMDSTWERWRRKARSMFSTAATFFSDSFTVVVPPPVFDAAGPLDGHCPGPLSLARIGPRVIKPILSSGLLNKWSANDLLRYLVNTTIGAKIEVDVGLDFEEVLSFAYSLEAYRSWTNGPSIFSGTNIRSDALFLLYYVFNNCEALPAVSGAANRKSKSTLRHQVESVAAVFGKTLLGRVC